MNQQVRGERQQERRIEDEVREGASTSRVSKPASEGDAEGRRERGWVGGCFCFCCLCDCLSVQTAAACLASRRDCGARDQLRGRQ